MPQDGLKLTVYIGERDRWAGGLLADSLMDAFERRQVRTSVLLRAVEGFGLRHGLQSDRLLTLSEDLPILAVAVDVPARIDAALADVLEFTRHGLITLERVELAVADAATGSMALASGAVKLTVHLARHDRVGGRPAHVAVVDCMHRHGLDGASVLVGLDGTAAGQRRRARMLDRNRHVPLMILGVGGSEAVAGAAPEIAQMLDGANMTLERVQICKRDGVLLAEPREPPPAQDGLSYWQKLVVYAGEGSRHEDEPLHGALVRRLRREGAAGATVIRGHWGFQGEQRPHGERFWSLARHVPALTVLLDTPTNMRRWFAIVDQMTPHAGLVTSELVPAMRVGAPDRERGGLRLAPVHPQSAPPSAGGAGPGAR